MSENTVPNENKVFEKPCDMKENIGKAMSANEIEDKDLSKVAGGVIPSPKPVPLEKK